MDPAAALQAEIDAISTSIQHERATLSYALTALVVLLYDYLLTLPTEVDAIWFRKKTLPSYLFLLNRYFALPATILTNGVAYFSGQNFTQNVCNQFVRFEGASTLILTLISELIIMTRVFALWKRDYRILALMLAIWFAQLVMMSWTLAHSSAVVLPPPLTGCVLTVDQDIGRRSVLFIVGSIVFDTVSTGLLLYGIYIGSKVSKLPVAQLMIRDGLFYFAVILTSNIVWIATGLTLPPDLQPINASFTQTITVVLSGRMLLNLRTFHESNETTVNTGTRLSTSWRYDKSTAVPASTVLSPRRKGSGGGGYMSAIESRLAEAGTFIEMTSFGENTMEMDPMEGMDMDGDRESRTSTTRTLPMPPEREEVLPLHRNMSITLTPMQFAGNTNYSGRSR